MLCFIRNVILLFHGLTRKKNETKYFFFQKKAGKLAVAFLPDAAKPNNEEITAGISASETRNAENIKQLTSIEMIISNYRRKMKINKCL